MCSPKESCHACDEGCCHHETLIEKADKKGKVTRIVFIFAKMPFSLNRLEITKFVVDETDNSKIAQAIKESFSSEYPAYNVV
jgi:hypothetical protein